MLTVRYVDTPVGAKEAASATGSEKQSFSNYDNIITGANDVPWATLEPGVWKLDGTRKILADSPSDIGWWSQLTSGADGRFDDPPILEISFAEPYTATALTFTFWHSTGQWCSELSISWYRGSTLLDSVATYPNATDWTVERAVESFDKITIEILATNNPRQFAKIQQIELGHVVTFDRNELVSVSLLNEADPTLCNLSTDTMRIEIFNRNGKLLIPQENQQVDLFQNGKLLAVQYIQESSREAQHFYTISCQSAIGLLGDDYLGGMYSSVPVETFLSDVLDGRKYELDASFAGMTVTGYLPICTRRVALQQLAFAIGAMVTTQGSDAIRLIPVPTEETGTFSNNKIFNGTSVKNAPRVARVVVVSHSYMPTNTEEVLLEDEDISGENVLFTFDEPHYDYVVDGGEITGCGANWVTITAVSTVNLSAKTYLHSTRRFSRKNPNAIAAERNNVVAVESATLIHSGNAQASLDRLYKAKMMRQTLSQEAVISGHHAGQLVTSVNPWGTSTRGYITSMESTLTQNGHTAQITILGTEISENSEITAAVVDGLLVLTDSNGETITAELSADGMLTWPDVVVTVDGDGNATFAKE